MITDAEMISMHALARPVHEALRTEYDGRTSLFECLQPGCRFRATLDHSTRRYALLDRGDASALHHGTFGPMTVDIRGSNDD